MEDSPVSWRYWKCPVRRSSELCSVLGDGEVGEGGGWVLQAFPLEQLSANSFFWGFRYICRCSSTSFRQVRCSWPQKTLQCNRRRNNIRIYSAGPDISVEVKQEYTSTIIQRFFSNTGKEAIRITLVITTSSSLTLHNTNLHPPYLPLAFPSHASSKKDCLGFGLRTRNLWVKNTSHMELPAWLTHYSLARKGGLWLNSKNRKIRGIFFQVFLERGTRERNRKEFWWFLCSTWLKHRKCQYLLREMYGYVLSVELRVMFLLMGMK